MSRVRKQQTTSIPHVHIHRVESDEGSVPSSAPSSPTKTALMHGYTEEVTYDTQGMDGIDGDSLSLHSAPGGRIPSGSSKQVGTAESTFSDSKMDTDYTESCAPEDSLLECEQGKGNRNEYLSPPLSCSGSMQSLGEQSIRSGAGWAKLRTTVKVAGAVNHTTGGAAGGGGKKRRKQSTLMRQDSFLKRFSTRHGGTTTQDGEDNEVAIQKIATKEKEQKKNLRFVINPDENFMFAWLAVLTIAVLYNLWTCIAREAFPDIQIGYEIIWFVTDGVCDLVYLMDIAVQLRTGYLERGLIVFNAAKLAKHYIYSKFFIIDMLSLLPLDLVQLFIGIHPIVRFPRFLKAYRSYRFAYMVETRTVYPNMWRVANLSHVLFLGSHWFAAFYFMISKAENFKGGWGYPEPVGDFSSVTRMYLKSLYWSTLTLTTIGDLPPPEENWE